ncbi:hypothetical protein CS022_02510 [Veronia nyctiphanis]|uniref:Uncharacterized protein n=1 Tax=Veronia nyctiphanis TaxID=1278244 RepID=A0A4Q0YTD5_9GAMM|nr:hypothetical protein [Veronia nyctiphanis]RXJ74480.1 hypothetical protein CS022_02510 [Veronia nyctiphanis]
MPILLLGCDSQEKSTSKDSLKATALTQLNQKRLSLSFEIKGKGQGYFAGDKTLTKSGTRDFKEGENTLIELFLSDYHSVETATGCNGTLEKNTFLIKDINENCNIEITITPDIFSITTNEIGEGSIRPSSFLLPYGEEVSFTATPDSYHSLISFTGCGGVMEDGRLAIRELTNDCNINAEFMANVYSIKTKVSGNGTITLLVRN